MSKCFGGGKWLAVCMVLALFAPGCMKKSSSETTQNQVQPPPPAPPNAPQRDMVIGSVQFEDAPLMAGKVELHDATGKVIAHSVIGADGTFQIRDVPEGQYVGTVSVRDWQVDDKLVLPKAPPGGQVGQPPFPPQGRPNGPPNGSRPGAPNGGPPTGPQHGLPGGMPQPPGMEDMKPPTMPLPALTKELKATYDRIDSKYEDPAKSGLNCTVGKGVTRLELWKLQAGTAAVKTP